MNIFQDYSNYYDLLYNGKDYPGEARYVHGLVQAQRPGAATLLDLGCGTGGHAFPLAELGYEVTGVDFSAVSLELAKAKLLAAPERQKTVSFRFGDVRSLRLGQRFDVVAALFHVLSYQTATEDLQAMLATARSHLAPGGIFLFDFWHGPGVLADPPKVAVKRLESDALKITRIAEPHTHPGRNLVDVHYTIFAHDKGADRISQTEEVHSMRYFFEPELRDHLAGCGFRLLFHYEWLTRVEPTEKSWNAVMAAALDF
ncbi:MAG: class I SAM-dependent methyltransferase [Proteobacteria bacterium]|nr:class I SAM-dependent methyltransferase [Pseudomonadota bacterium]